MPTPSDDGSTAVPYGSWPSPLSPAIVSSAGVRLREPGTNGSDLFWIESRPADGGRCVLVRHGNDGPIDLTSAPFNVRSRVHEYGGGAWAASGDILVFSNYADNRLYRIDLAGGEPFPITPEGGFRFADLHIDREGNRLFAVREDHSFPDAEAVNTIVSLSLDGPNSDGGAVIVSGTDFVSTPRLSPDRTQLAWLSWNHPNMPWDGTELWRASIDDEGTLADIQVVAGGASESIFQPGWDDDGRLILVSDRSGWWNLYRAAECAEPEHLTPVNMEFGVPQWVFGLSTWAITRSGSLIAVWTSDGFWYIGRIDPGNPPEAFDIPFTSIRDVRAHPARNAVVFVADSPFEPAQIVVLDVETGEWETIRRSSTIGIAPDNLSIAEPITWTTPDGSMAHGFYYAPTNADVRPPANERPPLIVESHGGPTSAASPALNPEIQFWTSRGFAFLDVNYGGSTGYGRTYRERLNGAWGVVDVDDCASGASSLVERGLVDPDRLVIRGSSAGGYTTLAALAFRSTFGVGVSYYGVGDLESLATDTHKYESRYMDSLVGPYPEARALYVERSPIHHVDRLNCAMILFQGLDDNVVPPNQALVMADAVRAKGLPLALLTFEGEGHGFRKAETVQRTLEAELSFYGQLFGFAPADDLPDLTIENLSPPANRT